MRIHCLENVDKALQFLREQRVHLENMGSHDIVDGNPRLSLGLIWTIILRFQVRHNIEVSNYCHIILSLYRIPSEGETGRTLCVKLLRAADRTSLLYRLLSIQTLLELCKVQGGSNMTGTDLCVNKPHCAAAVRP